MYADILKYLKENGALLNSIRPYFLITFQDYHSYIKQNPQDFPFQQKRVNEAAFRLMSLDAWIHVPRL